MFSIQETKRNGHPTLQLSGELTIYEASEARTLLAARLDAQGKKLELDLAGLEEIDTAGIQVLLWLRREAEARGKLLPFTNHNPAVLAVFDLLKVTALFGDPILITPTSR